MRNWLSFFVPRLNEHLTDDQIVDAWGSDLSPWEAYVTKWHLAHCSSCRVRNANLESQADRFFIEFQQHVKRTYRKPRHDNTEEFMQRQRQFLETLVPPRRWSFRLPMMTLPELSSFNPILATGVVMGICTVVCLLVWNHQRTPRIGFASLLTNAERWDTSQFQKSGSVVYQAVKFTTPNGTIQRTLYRDPQGKRRMKAVKESTDSVQLRASLTSAGVDWNEPLSASDYQRWHDGQRVRQDEVTRVGGNLLKLTTTSSQGPVETQTLVVRAMDFHPVQRTIEFRDGSENVQIAELEFKILPWQAVDVSLFEATMPANVVSDAANTLRVIPFPNHGAPTPEQLDEAELSARLVLNKLHADAGERIEVQRSPEAVVIIGAVNTDQRKNELQAQLRLVPHVVPAIQSIEELQRHPDTSEVATAMPRMESQTAQPSSLETYYLEHGRATSALGSLPHDLLDSAATVESESRTITDLLKRFGNDGNATALAQATFTDLLFAHRARLLAAVDKEEQLLDNAGIPAASASGPSLVNSGTLIEAAERNLALTKELAVGGGTAQRTAPAIAGELAASMHEVRARLQQLRSATQNSAATGARK